MNRLLFVFILLLSVFTSWAQPEIKLKKKDRKRDVAIHTTAGIMVVRLYDSTPLHRDNFLKMAKSHYYDSILFHRVISGFVIQAGDPTSKTAAPGVPLGGGSAPFTIPAEFRASYFHKKGVLAAARNGDNENPERRSSGSHFYIVQGKKFTDAGLDSVERMRLNGYRLPPAHREAYRTVGGVPHLDQQYTVYGELVSGIEVLDAIAAMPVNKAIGDRPLTDVRILKMELVKRKKR